MASLRKGTVRWTRGGIGFHDWGKALSHKGMFADTLGLSPLAYFTDDFQAEGKQVLVLIYNDNIQVKIRLLENFLLLSAWKPPRT